MDQASGRGGADDHEEGEENRDVTAGSSSSSTTTTSIGGMRPTNDPMIGTTIATGPTPAVAVGAVIDELEEDSDEEENEIMKIVEQRASIARISLSSEEDVDEEAMDDDEEKGKNPMNHKQKTFVVEAPAKGTLKGKTLLDLKQEKFVAEEPTQGSLTRVEYAGSSGMHESAPPPTQPPQQQQHQPTCHLRVTNAAGTSIPGAFAQSPISGSLPEGEVEDTNQTRYDSTDAPVATPVSEDLEEAIPVDEYERSASSSASPSPPPNFRTYGHVLLVLSLLVICIWLGDSNTRLKASIDNNYEPNHDSSGPDNSTDATGQVKDDTVSPFSSPGEYLQTLLPENTQSVIIDSISRNLSAEAQPPQAKAYNWLLADPQFLNYSDTRLQQRYAMATLGYSTRMEGSTRWPGWLNYQKHECEWGQDLAPRNLVLKENCNPLKSVQRLWFYDDLHGAMPPQLGLLTSMVHLGMQNCKKLTGVLPTELGVLRDLEIISLHNNQLSGPIPSELGLMQRLDDLRIHNNALTASIPAELGGMTRLRAFWALQNAITGPLPSELGLLPELMALELFSNAISGTIPTQIGKLVHLGEFTADGNHLSGPIPSEIGQLSELALVLLQDNDLTGSLPSQIGRMESVYRMYFFSNQLTGVLPTELGLLSRMQIALFHDNVFSASIPSQLGNWRDLFALYLNFNQQTGMVPNEWGDALKLRFDDTMDANLFSGSLPSTLGLLENLNYFWLPNGDLHGSIPTQFGLMKGLSTMSLANNKRLEGSIPLELSLLIDGGSLVHLNISGTAIHNSTA